METRGAAQGLGGWRNCQGCGGDRRGSRRGRRWGKPHNFPPQSQLLWLPCISSETTAAVQPSAWSATLPLVVESKGNFPSLFSLFFLSASLGSLFLRSTAVPRLSSAGSRVGDAATGEGIRATAGGWEGALGARRVPSAAALDWGGGCWDEGGIAGILC